MADGQPPQLPLGPVASSSNAQAEAEAEAALRAKYGGLLPRKKLVGVRDQRYFDSADWQMAAQRGAPAAACGAPPKLAPSERPGPERRPSQLGGLPPPPPQQPQQPPQQPGGGSN